MRLDEPPRVTIIDFKSGDPESDERMSLDEDEMRLQLTMYGLAAAVNSNTKRTAASSVTWAKLRMVAASSRLI
ncbi:PD-(D/E)XK nuclease superfamily protein [Mycobacterium xenopi 4042]|uniref:PD-(D/E)XK nuclease superfamily protein n=1 Tax=Mycobacterium xenopi 4042 TaxID=1299334 RepID=X8CAF3_MYCXE|nr:PD-(D/E)XK nuclease superfamily protein [Mycobacterium xenopi 4042]